MKTLMLVWGKSPTRLLGVDVPKNKEFYIRELGTDIGFQEILLCDYDEEGIYKESEIKWWI